MSKEKVVAVSRCHGYDGCPSVAWTVELRDHVDVAGCGSIEDLLVIGLRVEPAAEAGRCRSAAKL